jgi:hypothetical protein
MGLLGINGGTRLEVARDEDDTEGHEDINYTRNDDEEDDR